MTKGASVTARTRGWRVTLIVLIALVLCAQWAAAQTPGVDYETGDVCVDYYQPGSNCTAEDVRIASMSPTLDEICTIGGSATAQFTVELIAGANQRYDIGLFVATDGGSAQTGNSCYHDFLQPGSETEPWDVLGGSGPFYELEGTKADDCADIRQGESTFYEFQAAITIPCDDTDGDGVVDPISTCTSWDNNAADNCTDVTTAVPGTKAKCRCEDRIPDPPILIYRGYDWGDLPVGYGTTGDGGPRHAVHQDLTGTSDPDSQGGVPAVWLGSEVDSESDGQPGNDADGDDLAGVPDEDGVDLHGSWSVEGGGEFLVTVSTSEGTCPGCRLAFWIDWNQDGILGGDGSGEQYVQTINTGIDQTVSFTISESDWPDSPELYARFRLYDGNYTGAIAPTGMVRNGEVEDYYFDIGPTAVELVSFEAIGLKKAVLLTWETASEVDNLGFNLYRATSLDGPRTRINDELIPAGMFPGQYEYLDARLPSRIHYYWLEDLDIYGHTTLHGPVSVRTTTKGITNKRMAAK